MPPIFYIDLFSGAGGTTTGIHLCNDNVKVVACVNHDSEAIESHKANHPDCLHFIEDVRDFEVIKALQILVKKLRKEHPGCLIILWASLECTNYSKAKGGKPRDADSRTLAWTLYRKWSKRYKRYVKGPGYLQMLKPDGLEIENVEEFKAWGPLDENGKPISRLKGRDYVRFIRAVNALGYRYDSRMQNSANFGGFTSRNRYFGKFFTKGLPIEWAEHTHTKNPKNNGLFPDLPKWKACREVLDLEDEGRSIFQLNGNGKMDCEDTLKRYLAGLHKFVPKNENKFLQKEYSGHPESKCYSINGPAHTVTGIDHHKLAFIHRYNGGNTDNKCTSVNKPIGSLTAANRFSVVNTTFLAAYYGNGDNVSSIDKPCPTVPTKDRFAKVRIQHFTNYYSSGGQHSDIDRPSPAITGVPKPRLTTIVMMDQQYGCSKPHGIDRPVGTITANPKQNLVTVKSFLFNPGWGSSTSSVDKPSPTIVARQDKAPVSIINAQQTNRPFFAVPLFEDRESATMTEIRIFMALHYIIDIKRRMLKIPELKRIMGFPENYVLKGSETKQKKFIGNAVEVNMARAHISANVKAFQKWHQLKQLKQAV